MMRNNRRYLPQLAVGPSERRTPDHRGRSGRAEPDSAGDLPRLLPAFDARGRRVATGRDCSVVPLAWKHLEMV
jgi:hypothetical protein